MPDRWPNWVPRDARAYLAHIETGRSIRALARDAGCHASTVLRQVRKIETRRDDPLIDAALRHLGAFRPGPSAGSPDEDSDPMTKNRPNDTAPVDETTLTREARRILRRLCEPGAVLAVAEGLEKATVLRDSGDGAPTKTAVVDAPVAEAMALKEWIACDAPGRVSRYRVTASGRAALNRLIAEQENRVRGFSEAQAGFETGRAAGAALEEEDASPRVRRPRYALAESPLLALARRRDRDGTPFLSDGLVAAGERLREDFELAQLGGRVPSNWEQILTVSCQPPEGASLSGPDAARLRLARALGELGPGLADMALRCCCYLEGLEMAEKRMGWSARSGKIVLRIALQRLRRHYDAACGNGAQMIG
ncbi:DUF6456 domain-containing protein [Aestuariicoccus sp. MJ-SS9]|nr:DUF6456 domain-containing protein [Aestuariicoccus sp. MJ-SS9]MDU8911534.1 DUF6456 domain-containing protein [Aestuariicoccus sp. MJ-SS9]